MFVVRFSWFSEGEGLDLGALVFLSLGLGFAASFFAMLIRVYIGVDSGSELFTRFPSSTPLPAFFAFSYQNQIASKRLPLLFWGVTGEPGLISIRKAFE